MLPVVGRGVDGAVGEEPVVRVVAVVQVVPTPDERVGGSMIGTTSTNVWLRVSLTQNRRADRKQERRRNGNEMGSETCEGEQPRDFSREVHSYVKF